MDYDVSVEVISELLILSVGAEPFYMAQICQHIKNIGNTASSTERIGPLQVEVLYAVNS